jgi:acyl-CoA synthetase (AMP-forming)/AMP-acid ligase II
VTTRDESFLEEILAARAEQFPRGDAILSPLRSPLTNAGLHRQCGEVRNTLRGVGVGPNHRVAVALPQGPDLAVAVLAVASAAVCAPLDPSHRTSEYEGHLAQLRPRALIVPPAEDSPARAVARALGIPLLELFPAAPGHGDFTLRANGAGPRSQDVHPSHDTAALLLPTSGTTARSRWVPLSHRNLRASATNIVATLALGAEDRCLDVMPLHHIHGSWC